MPFFSTLNLSRVQRDPGVLMRLLVLIALVSMLLIVSLTALGIHRAAVEDVLRIAEDDAVRIGAVMVDQQYRELFAGGEQNISLAENRISLFHSHMKDFLHPFGIVKIKVFDTTGKIVYSTDQEIIGKTVEGNARLERSLRGAVDSQMETKDQVIDLAEEKRLNVDVVESYMPVRNRAKKIAGSFELYVDVTRYREEIVGRVVNSVLILTGILLGVFGLSFLVVRMGVQQLRKVLNQLQQMAVTDPLTGVFNRGAVLNRAEEELSRMQRRQIRDEGNSLGLIMIDIDHFKKVNDTYGHQAGDEVLREMSRRACACLREYDVFGRYGGEEFLAVIPAVDFNGAMVVAERIRHKLTTTAFKINGHALPITASLGVTCCKNPAEGVKAALQRADEALYAAKHQGRDRVVGHESDLLGPPAAPD
jgi:diguanylate cyclase (GGDEF)-like protein